MDQDGIQISVPELARKIGDERNADIIFYQGPIDDEGFGKLTEVALRSREKENVVFVLITNGGSANSAFKIARFLQRIYQDFTLFAPSNCYSAGTIIALGAHRLILGPFSELGPLDVQLLKLNELGARKSGLLTRSAFAALEDTSFELFESFMLKMMAKSGGLISFRVAAEISATLTSSLMSGVYSKIDPDTIGSDQRDLEVALYYGIRLAENGGNASLSTIYNLVHNYPAHDFIIDFEEASGLFNNVEFPSEDLMLLSAIMASETNGVSGTIVDSLSNGQLQGEESRDNGVLQGAGGSQSAEGASSGGVDDSGHSRRSRHPTAGAKGKKEPDKVNGASDQAGAGTDGDTKPVGNAPS